MTDKEKTEQSQKDYEKLVGQANDALTSAGVDVVAQLVIVLADGTHVPIQGIIPKPVVIEKQDEQQQTNSDSGEGADDEPTPEKTK